MNFIYLILGVLLVLELILFIYYLINNSIKRENKVFLFSCVIILIGSFLLNYSKIEIFNKISYNDFSLILIILQSSIVLNFTYKNYDLENKYNKLIKYVVEYEKIIDDQGKKNHEYNNQLLILMGYIDNKKKLKEYLNTIVEDHRTGQNFEIKQLHNFPNGGLKELLYCKLSKMKENNIKFYIYISNDIKDDFEKFDIKMYQDITKIFGVFLDNAIEAAYESTKKEVELDMKKDNNYIVVKISNTFKDAEKLSKIGKKGFTTKGIGHGYGLSIIKDIVKNNNKIEIITEKQNEMFIQTILIEL